MKELRRANVVLLRAVYGIIAMVAANDLPAHATILRFAGGNGTDLVDQYKGVAGDGWLEGWVETGVINASVVGIAPVNSSGNYLSLNDVAGGEGITRQFAAPTTYPYQLVLDLRVDHVPTSGTINLSTGSYRSVNTDASNYVQANATPGGFWRLAGNGVTVSSDILLVQGSTYHFDFTIDPVAMTYIATISDGTKSFTSDAIAFRNQSPHVASPYFELGAQSGSLGYAFSLDNVGIIPEPTSVMLLACGLLFLFSHRRRR